MLKTSSQKILLSPINTVFKHGQIWITHTSKLALQNYVWIQALGVKLKSMLYTTTLKEYLVIFSNQSYSSKKVLFWFFKTSSVNLVMPTP